MANPVLLEDSVIAHVDLPGDVDYFTVSLQAGTSVTIVSSDLSPVVDWTWIMELTDSSGVRLAQNESYNDWLPGTRIWFSVTRTGRYYVRIYNQPVGSSPTPARGQYPYTLRISSFHPVLEHEPNDHAALANVVALGDTVSGILAWGDSDYYALDLDEGTNLNLAVSSIEVSCTIVPEIRLWTSDGRELDRRQSSPYNGSWNPRLEYVIPATGRYYVSFGSYLGGNWPSNPCYFLKIGTFTMPPPGPAEPIRVIASNLGGYDAIASSRVGDVYVASGICQTPERDANNRVARLRDDGSLQTIADHLALTGDLAVDHSGNVLVPGIDSRHAVVWRITPSGERSVLVQLPSAACALAVGPDGDVWVSEYATGATLRVDSLGQIKASVELGFYVDRIKFSPDGVLHYLRVGSLFKLENGDTTRLTNGWPKAWTYDRDGYQYVSRGDYGGGYYGYNLHNKIELLDPALQSVMNLVAYVNFPVGMTFVPDRSGAPTKRLLVLYHPDAANTAIGELNSAGIRAPGP